MTPLPLVLYGGLTVLSVMVVMLVVVVAVVMYDSPSHTLCFCYLLYFWLGIIFQRVVDCISFSYLVYSHITERRKHRLSNIVLVGVDHRPGDVY